MNSSGTFNLRDERKQKLTSKPIGKSQSIIKYSMNLNTRSNISKDAYQIRLDRKKTKIQQKQKKPRQSIISNKSIFSKTTMTKRSHEIHNVRAKKIKRSPDKLVTIITSSSKNTNNCINYEYKCDENVDSCETNVVDGDSINVNHMDGQKKSTHLIFFRYNNRQNKSTSEKHGGMVNFDKNQFINDQDFFDGVSKNIDYKKLPYNKGTHEPTRKEQHYKGELKVIVSSDYSERKGTKSCENNFSTLSINENDNIKTYEKVTRDRIEKENVINVNDDKFLNIENCVLYTTENDEHSGIEEYDSNNVASAKESVEDCVATNIDYINNISDNDIIFYTTANENYEHFQNSPEMLVDSQDIIEDNIEPDTSGKSGSEPYSNKDNHTRSSENDETYASKTSSYYTIHSDVSSTVDTANDQIRPIGFCNPAGYCFLNCVVQVLRGCLEFNTSIINYFKSNLIEEFVPKGKEELFVNNLCLLFNSLNEDDTSSIDDILREIHNFFIESKEGDDVQKCFMTILKVTKNITKQISLTDNNIQNSEVTIEERKFIDYKKKNEGFIFDLFYGQMSHSTVCSICEYTIFKSYQLFNCLPIPVPNSTSSATISGCIQYFFNKSDFCADDPMKCQCETNSSELYSQSQITHAPKYILIYLTRGSYYVDGEKNTTFVHCDEKIDIDTSLSTVPYRCISVIDHIGDNVNGHYYCKCNYEGQNWWLISDSQVTDIGSKFEDIVSRDTIAFMFKRIK